MPRPVSETRRTLCEAAERLGLTPKALEMRMKRLGLTAEEAIGKGGRAKPRRKEAHDWSGLERLGVKKSAVYLRARVTGLTVDEVLAGKSKPRPKPPGKLYYGPNGRITLDFSMLVDKGAKKCQV